MSLFHGPLSVVCASGRARLCPSVHALTFSLNIFFSETIYRILMKFHRNVLPWSSSEFVERIRFLQKLWLPWQQNLKLKSLKIFLSETIRLRATQFGMLLYLMGLFLQIIALGSNLIPPLGSQVLHGII